MGILRDMLVALAGALGEVTGEARVGCDPTPAQPQRRAVPTVHYIVADVALRDALILDDAAQLARVCHEATLLVVSTPGRVVWDQEWIELVDAADAEVC